METTAYLSNEGRYTLFEFRDKRLKILSPLGLERYISINEFKPEKGYIAVMTKYSDMDEPEEEYIDLLSTLDELYMDRNNFLKPIEKLEVRYV